MKRLISFLCVLCCASVMGWATDYCHTELTAGGKTIYLTCQEVTSGNYQLKVECNEVMSGLGGSFCEVNGVGGYQLNAAGHFTLSGDGKTITCDIESDRAPRVYTPLYVIIDGEKNFGDISDASWAACGDVKTDPSLSINATEKTLSAEAPAETFQIVASQSGDGAISYESSNAGIASVSNTGLVTAVGRGTAKITVRTAETDDYAAASKTLTVTVTGPINWEGVAWLANSNEKYKLVITPDIADTYGGKRKDGDNLWVGFPSAEFGACSIEYSAVGAGVSFALSNFEDEYSQFTMVCAGTTYTFDVYHVQEALNLAKNQPSYAGYNPENAAEQADAANDDNDGTAWVTWSDRPASEEWWYVDLGASYDLTSIDVLWGGDYSTKYILQARIAEPSAADKANDDAWLTMATVTDAAANATKTTTVSRAARYVRLHSLTKSVAACIRLREVRIYGSGAADADAVKPTFTSATLDSKTKNKAVINVVATDNDAVMCYHVVDGRNSIDMYVAPVDGTITVSNLTAGTSYNFTITAIDPSGNVSDSKAVAVTTDEDITVPNVAAPNPPAREARWIRPIYTDAYASILEHDFAKSNWGSVPLMDGEEKAIGGNHYLLYDMTSGTTVVWGENNAGGNAIVAQDDYAAGGDKTGVDASAMEYLHIDIWSNVAMENICVRVNDEILRRINLTDEGWQQFDIALVDPVETLKIDNVRWFKFTDINDASRQNIAFDNVYFWRTPVAADETAPTGLTASVVYTDLYTAIVAVSATDDNDNISYTIKQAETVKASGSGSSGETTNIRITGLDANTHYSFSVIATDLSDNVSAPVAIALDTKALPASAPAPTLPAAAVKSLYSNAYTPNVTVSNYCEAWWQAPTLHQLVIGGSDNVLYYEKEPGVGSAFGWAFADPKVDANGFQNLHFSIYPMKPGTIELYPVKNGGGELYRTSQTLVAETWNEVVLDYSNETLEDVFKQLGFRNYSDLGAFFIDNVYFFKTDEVTLDQNATSSDVLNSLNGAYANVTIERNLSANGNFKTLCLPFSMNAEQIAETFGDCEILMLTGGRMKSEKDIYVQYEPVNEIIAGKPYLMTVDNNVPSLDFNGVLINSSTANNEISVNLGGGKSIAMVGTFVKLSLTDADFYLSNDGYLYSVKLYGEENGGAVISIPAFRCYYRFTGFGDNPAGVMVRVVRGTDVYTDVEDMTDTAVATKQLRDGQLFIVRDGMYYTVTGLKVK